MKSPQHTLHALLSSNCTNSPLCRLKKHFLNLYTNDSMLVLKEKEGERQHSKLQGLLTNKLKAFKLGYRRKIIFSSLRQVGQTEEEPQSSKSKQTGKCISTHESKEETSFCSFLACFRASVFYTPKMTDLELTQTEGLTSVTTVRRTVE